MRRHGHVSGWDRQLRAGSGIGDGQRLPERLPESAWELNVGSLGEPGGPPLPNLYPIGYSPSLAATKLRAWRKPDFRGIFVEYFRFLDAAIPLIVPPAPESAPYRILERLRGLSLATQTPRIGLEIP